MTMPRVGSTWIASARIASARIAPARLGSNRGQTMTEYLMIAGILTAIAIFVLTWWYEPFRASFQKVADCVISDKCK